MADNDDRDDVPKDENWAGVTARLAKLAKDTSATDKMPTDDEMLGYMGHLANDDVMIDGHNTGKKPKGKAIDPYLAKKGYRKLPGSAMYDCGRSVIPSVHISGVSAEYPTMRVFTGAKAAGPLGPQTPVDLKREIASAKSGIDDAIHGRKAAKRRGDAMMEKVHAKEIATHKGNLKKYNAQMRKGRSK